MKKESFSIKKKSKIASSSHVIQQLTTYYILINSYYLSFKFLLDLVN